MRHALAVIFLLFAGTAHADSAEDFIACVTGRAAVALIHDNSKDDALEIGYDMCPLPADPNDEIDVDAIGTTIALMVERMAAE
jgi:hypothetical protein